MMSNNYLQINEMKDGDLPAVRILAEQLGYPSDIADLNRRFHSLLKSQDHKLFVALNGDQQIVGGVHVGKEMSSLLADDRADIGALVVDNKVRSQGIGASLMTTAEKWATDRNLKLMRVRSNMKRTDAWHLFTKTLKGSEQ